MKLHVRSLAIASGLIWGVGLFAMTWFLILVEGATGDKLIIGRFYLGYDVSPLGSLIGLLWAVPDGFIAGGLFGWLYNTLLRKSRAE